MLPEREPVLFSQAMKAAQVLLASKPEEENNLLKILVNKLGDPSRKVGLFLDAFRKYWLHSQ